MTTIFGGSWGAPMCEGAEMVETPVGQPCGHCDELIARGDQGTFLWFFTASRGDLRPIHKECGLRQVLGGYGHHQDHYYWCCVKDDPDGGLSRRESAKAVWAWAEQGGTPLLGLWRKT